MTTQITFEFAQAQKVKLVQSDSVVLHLIGCGGTGSWLAPGVARVAKLMKDNFRKEVFVYFWDPDSVEEKDIYRQNFCYAEIGMNKAEALAIRYSLAWGIEIIAYPQKFASRYVGGGLKLLIGCVDNAAARTEIANERTTWNDMVTTWWLDCGNGKQFGQVVLGAGCQEPENRFPILGYCTWLPWPSDRFPSLLEDQPASTIPDEAQLSCAELAMVNEQGLAINQMVASVATDYLVELLLTETLCKQETFIELDSGVMKSTYILK